MVVKKAVKKSIAPKVANMFDSKKAVTLLVLLLALSTLSYMWWNKSKFNVAVHVNGDTVTLKEYQRNFEGMKKYREGQGESFLTEDSLKKLRQETVDTLISNTVIAQHADVNGIKVTSDEIDAEYNKIVDANTNGDEDKFKDQINSLYGFSVNEYKYYFVKSSLLEKRLRDKVTESEDYKKTAKDSIDKAYAEVTSGVDFSEVVDKYSEDDLSKANKGDMGWLKRGQSVKEFEDVAFSLEKGNVSKVFETVQGFHVLKVTDKKNSEVKISQILTIVQPFDKWVKNKVSESNVKILVSI